MILQHNSYAMNVEDELIRDDGVDMETEVVRAPAPCPIKESGPKVSFVSRWLVCLSCSVRY
jgi:hypothetical protein